MQGESPVLLIFSTCHINYMHCYQITTIIILLGLLTLLFKAQFEEHNGNNTNEFWATSYP